MKNQCLTRLAVLFCLFVRFGLGEARAGTIIWSSTSGSAWLTTTNWTGGNAPGTSDIAEFDNNPSSGGASAGVGVNYGNAVNSGSFNGVSGYLNNEGVGAIIVTSTRTNTLFIGNTKSTNSGYMTFNGATFNGQANTILSNASTKTVTIQNNVQGSSSTTFGVVLGGTANFVQTAVGTGTSNGSTIIINSSIDQANSGSSITLLGNGTGSLNGGVLELAGTNGFTGGITVGNSDGSQAGTVQIDTTSSLPTSGTVTVNSNSQLLINGAGNFGGTGQTMNLNGVGTVSNSGALRVTASATWQGTVTLGSDTVISVTGANAATLSGTVNDNGHQLQKQGGGTLVLSGTGNNMTGSTLVGSGTITVNAGSSLGSGNLQMAQSSTNNTAVIFNNTAQSIGNLSSSFAASTGTQTQTITLNSTALTINETGSSSFGVGIVSSTVSQTSTITGSGSVILGASSTGALTFTGSNNYTGGTLVKGGKLFVNGSISGTTTIYSAGTLGGTGTVGAVSALASGTLSPGVNGPGILSTGSLSLNSGAHLAMDLNGTTAGSGYDQIKASAAINLNADSGSKSILNLSLGYVPTQGDLFFLVINGGGAITSTFAGLPDDSIFNLTSSANGLSYAFEITYFGNSSGSSFTGGNDVALQVVPEPQTWAMLLGGLSVLIFVQRLRRRAA
jgi:autotransporter-associated beta strand protein